MVSPATSYTQTAPADLLWDETTSNGNSNNNNKPINKIEIKVETLLIRKNEISTLKSMPHVNCGRSLLQGANPGFQLGDGDRTLPSFLWAAGSGEGRAEEALSLGLWEGEPAWGQYVWARRGWGPEGPDGQRAGPRLGRPRLSPRPSGAKTG